MGRELTAGSKRRDFHHRIALLLAIGKSHAEIAAVTGYSKQSIAGLKMKEHFQALMKHYEGKVEAIEIDTFRQVTAIRAAIYQLSMEELRDRLEEEPESFSINALIELQADCADRLGHSKVSRQDISSTTLNIDLAESLAEARRRELSLSASSSLPGDAAGVPGTKGPPPGSDNG